MQLSLAEYIGVDTEYSKICTTITVSVDNIGKIFFDQRTRPHFYYENGNGVLSYRD